MAGKQPRRYRGLSLALHHCHVDPRCSRDVWPVYGGPARDVPGSDVVGKSRETADHTEEYSLRLPIGFSDMSTGRACARSVARINRQHRDAPTHWIYRDLIQGGGASTYYSGAKDNPYNSPAYLIGLAKLTGVLAQRLVHGKWVQAEGAVYDEYDPAIHVIDAAQCPEFTRRICAVDFGFTNPFVCQWWGFDSDDRMYLYRELYVTRQLVEDLAGRILTQTGAEAIESVVADHDAEDRATLARHGIDTGKAIKDVSPGIQAVQARLKVQPDGKPRLYVVRGALVELDPLLESAKRPICTQDEFPAYSWPKGQDGKPNKEAPVKVDDHGMDALRYAVMHIDNGLSGQLVF